MQTQTVAAKPSSLDVASAMFSPLRRFIGRSQLSAMRNALRGEEGDWFGSKMIALASEIEAMPKTYETDGQGDRAIVHLHYFKGGADWFITERDMESEQAQAFGYADLGYGGELGYISITELIANGVELDLHWSPKPLAACKK